MLSPFGVWSGHSRTSSKLSGKLSGFQPSQQTPMKKCDNCAELGFEIWGVVTGAEGRVGVDLYKNPFIIPCSSVVIFPMPPSSSISKRFDAGSSNAHRLLLVHSPKPTGLQECS